MMPYDHRAPKSLLKILLFVFPNKDTKQSSIVLIVLDVEHSASVLPVIENRVQSRVNNSDDHHPNQLVKLNLENNC